MDVDIKLFEILCAVAKEHGVTDIKWAKESWGKEASQSRIGELRQILRLINDQGLSQAEASSKVGRRWSLQKCCQTTKGLRAIVGEQVVQRRMAEAIRQEKDPCMRLHLMVEALPSADVERAADILNAAFLHIPAGSGTPKNRE